MNKKILKIEFSFKKHNEKITPIKNFIWFNTQSNKMETFKGSRLVFKDNKPTCVTDEITISKNKTDSDAIDLWMRDIGIHFNIDVIDQDNNGIVISFIEKYADVIEYSLDRHGIRYSEV